MGNVIDIFNPQISKIASGLEGKTVFIYGGNNVGKTFTAAHMEKPYFLACESGLNGLAGIPHNKISNWADFKKVVRQLTGKSTVAKARELYSTIVIDEVYASSIFCQDYILATYGDGALTFGDMMGKRNGYSLYEKEYFRIVNQLLSADYTVVFIGHGVEKDGKITPKGDKRCINPIIDNADFVIYAESNGVDENGKALLSSGYFVETNRFFARSRFPECVPVITPLSAENIERAINDAIAKGAEKAGVETITYEEQKAETEVERLGYNELMENIQNLCISLAEAGYQEQIMDIIEETLGVGVKVSSCTKRQIDALNIIYDELTALAEEVK